MLPTREEAERELAAANARNPGPWSDHSRYAAQACERIAARCTGLDADTAYVLGLLHDIGRRCGRCLDHHMPEGFRYCKAMGWDKPAQICITHGYMLQGNTAGLGDSDLTPQDRDLIAQIVSNAVYDDYDRLVQMCDSLAVPTGFCLLETRFVDVALRYGTPPITVPRWQKIFEIKAYFEAQISCSIYDLLPGIEEHHL
jgi:hypothetical protein